MQSIMWGRHGGLRQVVTLHLMLGSKEKGMLVLSFFLFVPSRTLDHENVSPHSGELSGLI